MLSLLDDHGLNDLDGGLRAQRLNDHDGGHHNHINILDSPSKQVNTNNFSASVMEVVIVWVLLASNSVMEVVYKDFFK